MIVEGVVKISSCYKGFWCDRANKASVDVVHVEC